MATEAELRARIRELEARLEESEETLDAIRRGEVDALVVAGPADEHQVYTLESADRPYRILIEQIGEGAVTLSDDGIVLYCNRRLAGMVGEAQERVIGRPLAQFVAAEDRDPFARMMQAAKDDGARGDLTLRAVDGTMVPIYVSLNLLRTEDGATLLCGVLTDLTEQKAHVRELADANARLLEGIAERERIEDALRQSQKMEAIGQLTGGVAHDFNNLLTIIRSSAHLLRRPDLPEDRRSRYVAAIADTVDRASKLTSQLLAFARKQTLRPEVFDVPARLRGVVDMLRTIVGSRIAIGIEVPDGDACRVRADLSQFDTALVNLVVNARDAMDGAGTLTLRVEDGGGAAAGPYVTVSVTDTGSGIAADDLPRIFDPFYTTKEVGKGTGLGLSQVFGFTKQSGGEVAVDSVVGRGTTFTLHLPRVAGALSDVSALALAPARANEGGGRRVLVVEDNVEVGTFSTQILQDLGYRTAWAANATEALLLLETSGEPFDAVFSDVVMPGMSGLELGAELRRRYPGLPVLLTSGYSHVLASEGRHGFEVLQKPYAVDALAEALRRALDGARVATPVAGGQAAS